MEFKEGSATAKKFVKVKAKRSKLIYYLSTPPDECSEKIEESPVLQRWFKYMTCGQCNSDDHTGICKQCAEKCHKGHIILDRGIKREKCQCFETKHCQLKK